MSGDRGSLPAFRAGVGVQFQKAGERGIDGVYHGNHGGGDDADRRVSRGVRDGVVNDELHFPRWNAFYVVDDYYYKSV